MSWVKYCGLSDPVDTTRDSIYNNNMIYSISVQCVAIVIGDREDVKKHKTK